MCGLVELLQLLFHHPTALLVFMCQAAKLIYIYIYIFFSSLLPLDDEGAL